jgi:hypothetical protein
MRVAAIALAAVVLLALDARAGDRELEVLFGNLTPDAESSPASRACVAAIEKRIRADYTRVNRIGETALRKLVGKTAGEPFLDWPAEAYRPARQRGETWIDAVILVDCRPEKAQLDVLVQPMSPALVRLAVHGVKLDETTTRFVSKAILRRAWAGFTP